MRRMPKGVVWEAAKGALQALRRTCGRGTQSREALPPVASRGVVSTVGVLGNSSSAEVLGFLEQTNSHIMLTKELPQPLRGLL